MPFARLTTRNPLKADDAKQLASDLTDLICRDLRKQKDLTALVLESSATFVWAIGGSEAPEAAHLEVCVTAGTNSDSEKQNFIKHAAQLLRSVCPALDVATYIVVREVAGENWGFDGKTQAARRLLLMSS